MLRNRIIPIALFLFALSFPIAALATDATHQLRAIHTAPDKFSSRGALEKPE